MTDFLEKFDSTYLPKLGMRAPTFRAVMREAVHRCVLTVVETGCIRKENNWAGDGQSTIIWEDYTKWMGGSLTSIDLDPEAIDLIRKICPTGASIVGDSVIALSGGGEPIDLLYLDSFDVDMADAGPAAMHCLFEFCAARPRLHSGSIVFIDDSPMTSENGVGGKGAYVFKWFQHLGVTPFTWGYQIAWIMP